MTFKENTGNKFKGICKINSYEDKEKQNVK